MVGKKGKSEVGVDTAVATRQERLLGEVGVDSVASATMTLLAYSRGNFGELPLEGIFAALNELAEKAEAGDTIPMRAMLASQALTLNAVFSDLARLAALNMTESLPAADTFLRLALKAQAQSRSTVEALDRLVHGREQTVRHVHVDNRGGQAVITESVHTGGRDIETSDKQSHATYLAGGGGTLPCPHPLGSGLPMSGCKGPQKMPDARRHKSGSA